jgi:ArsR family transcriptional regulator
MSLSWRRRRRDTSTVIDPTIVESFEADVQRFKALGDPTRLQILHVLAAGGRCVCEIQPKLDVPPNLLSHHLKVLREAGLVVAERSGRRVHYELAPDGLEAAEAAVPKAASVAHRAACACGRERVPA